MPHIPDSPGLTKRLAKALTKFLQKTESNIGITQPFKDQLFAVQKAKLTIDGKSILIDNKPIVVVTEEENPNALPNS